MKYYIDICDDSNIFYGLRSTMHIVWLDADLAKYNFYKVKLAEDVLLLVGNTKKIIGDL